MSRPSEKQRTEKMQRLLNGVVRPAQWQPTERQIRTTREFFDRLKVKK